MGFWSWLVPPADLESVQPQRSAQHIHSRAASETPPSKLSSGGLHPALSSLFIPGSSQARPQQGSLPQVSLRLKLPSLQAGLLLAPELVPALDSPPASVALLGMAPVDSSYQASILSQTTADQLDSAPLHSQSAYVPSADAPPYNSSSHSSSSSSSTDDGSTGPAAMRNGNAMHAAEAATPPSDTAPGRQQTSHDVMQTVKLLLAGGLAGAISKTATAPLARLTILYQVCAKQPLGVE